MMIPDWMRDAPEWVTLRDVVRTAKYQHVCCMCKKTIRVGVKYRYVFGIEDGHPTEMKYHTDCHLYMANGEEYPG